MQTQTLDALVSQTLLRQAIKKSGVTVTDAQVETQIATIKKQFPDTAAFEQALAGQGITEDAWKMRIREELSAQAYLDQTLKLSSVNASEEEIATAYKQAADAAGKDAPSLASVHDQAKAFVIQQKQQQLVVEFVKTLRAQADVKILI